MTINHIRSFGTRAQLAGLVLSGGWTTKKLLKTSIQTFASSNEVANPLLMRFKLVILRKASSQNLLSFITNIDPSKKQCNVPSVIFNPVILLGLWTCPPIEWACVISETFYLAPAHDLLVPNILLSCICLPVEMISFEQSSSSKAKFCFGRLTSTSLYLK